ncbi:MAG: hypothetical protein IPN13_10425 [Bacteroidetes bacterium]|nr:hypothetical protein [Bacteroidota bacterium]
MSDKNENTEAANPENEKNPENTSKQDSTNPAVPDGDTESVNTPLLTEPMEVHHHAHSHGKKNWKSYIREFLMLFLAVFCGSLAEYQLEHKIERDRAHELAKSFYEELKSDSLTAVIKCENRIRQEQALQYLSKYFKDSSLTDPPKLFAVNFEYGISFRTPGVFEPKTAILEQLKSSGSLRYFKNETFQSLVGDISIAIRNIYDRQALETSARIEYLNPLLVKHHDYEFWNTITKGNTITFDVATKNYDESDEFVPFRLRGVDKIDRDYVSGCLSFYSLNAMQSTRTVHIQKYRDLNAQLLQLLRSNYGLE